MFGFVRELVVKMFIPRVDDLVAFAMKELGKLWNSGQGNVEATLIKALQKTPLKDTATPQEMHELIEAIEELLEEIGDTKEYKRVQKAVKAITTR